MRRTAIRTGHHDTADQTMRELETQTGELTEHTDRLQEVADATSDLVTYAETQTSVMTEIRDALLAQNDLLAQIRDGRRTPPVFVVDKTMRLVGMTELTGVPAGLDELTTNHQEDDLR